MSKKNEIKRAEMALKVSRNLTPAIEHLRETGTKVWVFNRKRLQAETVCITIDKAYAQHVSEMENIPMTDAAEAFPIPLEIH